MWKTFSTERVILYSPWILRMVWLNRVKHWLDKKEEGVHGHEVEQWIGSFKFQRLRPPVLHSRKPNPFFFFLKMKLAQHFHVASSQLCTPLDHFKYSSAAITCCFSPRTCTSTKRIYLSAPGGINHVSHVGPALSISLYTSSLHP